MTAAGMPGLGPGRMTTISIPTEILERAGLSSADTDDWAAAAPGWPGSFKIAAGAISVFLTRGQALIRRLPAPTAGTADQNAAREAIAGVMNDARESFLHSH
ncbi:MAG TPA: hypothetical protein VGA04_28585, partial [Streptosporangiaceae bacterium]